MLGRFALMHVFDSQKILVNLYGLLDTRLRMTAHPHAAELLLICLLVTPWSRTRGRRWRTDWFAPLPQAGSQVANIEVDVEVHVKMGISSSLRRSHRCRFMCCHREV